MSKNELINDITEELFNKFDILIDESKKVYLADIGSKNCWEIDSPESRTKIEKYCYDEHHQLLQPKDTKLVIDQVKARAKFESTEVTVNQRTAKDGSSLIVDLGQENDSRVVVSDSGVQLAKVDKHYFLRNSSMKAMASPEEGAGEADLRKLVNTSNANWIVLYAWMTFVLFVTRLCSGAYPLLMINAPKGSGKTSLCRFLMGLLDPQEAPVRVFPKNEQDLIIALQQSNILCFDNLRKITQSISDVMCQSATGGHYTTRELFTNGNEYRMWIKNAIIINSLHSDMATEMDLISRTVLLELSPIDDSDRRTDADLQAEFTAKKGLYFGAILDGISKAMAHLDNVELEELTRMADFCRWGSALEKGMGWPDGSFMDAYKANQKKLQKVATVENLLVQTVVDFMAECRGNWKSTPAELLQALNSFSTAGGRNNPKVWPQTPAALSRRLEANQDALMINDVEVILYRSKHRQVELLKIDNSPEKSAGYQKKVVNIHTDEALPTEERALEEGSIIEGDQAFEALNQVQGELNVSNQDVIQCKPKPRLGRRRNQRPVDMATEVQSEKTGVSVETLPKPDETSQRLVEEPAGQDSEDQVVRASVTETVVEGLTGIIGDDYIEEKVCNVDEIEPLSSVDKNREGLSVPKKRTVGGLKSPRRKGAKPQPSEGQLVSVDEAIVSTEPSEQVASNLKGGTDRTSVSEGTKPDDATKPKMRRSSKGVKRQILRRKARREKALLDAGNSDRAFESQSEGAKASFDDGAHG